MTNHRKDYRRKLEGKEGRDFVRCRMCGDHRRVISTLHLRKHDTTREDYMVEHKLSPDQLIAKDFRVIQSSRPGYEPLDKREWKLAIRKVYQETGNVFAKYLQKEYPHIYNQGVWICGDWDKALGVAGFDPETMRQTRFWDQEKVIKRIIALRMQSVPLNALYISQHYPSLFAAARRQFGTWNRALRAAGVMKHRPCGNPLNVLRALRDLRESESKKAIPAPLESNALLYFGSLEKADAASKRDNVNGWNKPSPIARA